MQLKKIGLVFMLLATLLLAGCEVSSQDSTEKGQETQEQLMSKAQSQVKVPQTNNFLTRKSVAKWMERQDTYQQEYYIYVYGNNGNVIGYYVAQSRPVSTCTFMTPPERYYDHRFETEQLGKSPALDGVYYGDEDCDQWFFFDASTDAMIEIRGFKFITSDQPLKVDAEALNVRTSE